MRTKIVKDLTANSTQVLVNLLLGLLIFFITSRYLDKAMYGEFNWSLAVLGFSTTLLSLRLEQVVVRKIAAGADASRLFSVFFGHVFCSGILFYALLSIASFIFPSFFSTHSLLMLLAVSQLMSFFSTPFKQLATGKERFGWLAVMCTSANLVRAFFLLIVVFAGVITVPLVITIFIFSSVIEWIVCAWLVRKYLNVRFMKWPLRDYGLLLRESLPQVGVVFLNACIARIDWILLGLFTTQVVTAEYSFAYKLFELSPVPLLILGPVLLTRFSALFGNHSLDTITAKQKKFGTLIRVEMIMATVLPLLLNIAWSPVMDRLTQYKYGTSNAIVFLLLSCCIPFQYFINLCWTAHFAQNRLKMIFRITLVSCLVIVIGDCILIPMLNARGAAIAYLAAMAIEYALYCRSTPFILARDKWLPLVSCVVIAFASGTVVQGLDLSLVIKMLLALLLYIIMLIPAKQLRRSDLLIVKQYLFPSPVKMETV